MATAVEMPKLGNSVEECLLAKWLKRVGDAVSSGEIIAEIETDKATFELNAPCDGVLLATFCGEGALVPVYTNVCVIGQAGEDPAPFAPSAAAAATPASAAAVPDAPIPSEPMQVETAAPAQAAARWSPRARRYAREHGVRADAIPGSGPGGRVLEQDVRDFRLSGEVRAQRRDTAAAGPAAAVSARRSQTGVPFGGIREKIARRMRESLAQTAQYTLTSSADARALLALRQKVKVEHPDLNINALVLFCTVEALRRMPSLNAELRDGALKVHEEIHLGFACDTERGLLVPVIRDAQALTAVELATRARVLVDAAVKGTIGPDDLSGGTFTVSNLGGLGIESFTPILNAPQVAILGVNAIELRPVRTDTGIEMVERIGLSLTCDHQVIDGAPGARFLGVLRDCIESLDALVNTGKGGTCTTS